MKSELIQLPGNPQDEKPEREGSHAKINESKCRGKLGPYSLNVRITDRFRETHLSAD